MSSRTPSSASRRELLKLAAAGLAGSSLSGWLEVLAARAAEQSGSGKRTKSCILLWMDGGPSHLDTFDPKPEAPAEVRGDLEPIATSVPGIQICERFPRLAQSMHRAAIIRSMTTQEGDHELGRIYLHTGYKPNVGGLVHPTLGSIASAELGQPDFPLPNFVVTGGLRLPNMRFVTHPGYLGPRHRPLVVGDPTKGVQNLRPAAGETDLALRMSVLDQLEQGFHGSHRLETVTAHRTNYQRALQLIRSEKTQSFDLWREPESARARYGEHDFGQGCLLARRLVEVGVPFVEVYLPDWDAHDKRVADRVKELMPAVDQAMSALIGDLEARGLLDQTLVIWMGEFGRTFRINRDGGRDHQNKAWTTMLLGGGIRGGQVIGRSDSRGAMVADRPVTEVDFLATVCKILGIDYTRQIDTPIGRPIRIVDKGENLITELFS